MDVKFAVFRYQPDLRNDHWIPLGVVAECSLNDDTIVAVVCLQTIDIEGTSELTSAILQDIPQVLRNEIESSCARLKPGEDFLEVLRASNPWNFHFTAPKPEVLDAADMVNAVMQLFYEHVLKVRQSRNGRHLYKPRRIQPQRMEMYDFALSGGEMALSH